MPEQSSEVVAETTKLRELVRKRMDAADGILRFERLRTSLLQSFLLLSLAGIALLAFVAKDYGGTVPAVIAILAGISSVVVSYLIGFRSPERLAKYLVSRDQLHRTLLDIDLCSTASAASPADLERIRKKLGTLMEAQRLMLEPTFPPLPSDKDVVMRGAGEEK